MDSTFTYPPPRAAIPRPRPSGSSAGPRESNALRASVLDVALELGLSNNSLVAEWMFNNSVKEEEEEGSTQSPGLTQSSSTASEDQSSPRIPPTPFNFDSSPTLSILPTVGKPVASWNPSKITTDIDIPYLSNDPFSASVNFPTFQETPILPRPVTPSSAKKLKKKKGGDGYDSDGGYLSEAGKKKKGSEELSKKEAKARLKEEKREQKELKEEERRRKKSLGALSKASKKQQDDFFAGSGGGGYESDGIGLSKSPFKKKSKKTSTDTVGGYETDVGYQSAGANTKKSKSRFFKLGSKSSREVREAAQPVPEPHQEPVPAMPLPIAERFATSLGSLSPPEVESPTTSPSINSASTAKTYLPLFSDETSPSAHPPLPVQEPLSLDFSSVTYPSSAPANIVQDRSSLSSAETTSSISSNSRRRAFLPPSRENSLNQGHSIAESISTISSSSHQYNSSNPRPPSSHSQSNSSVASSPHTLHSPGVLKPPSISFPLTRSTSPMALGLATMSSPIYPTAPLHITKVPKLHLDVTSARGASPLPLSPGHSPHVVVTSSPSSATIASPFSSVSPSPNYPAGVGAFPRPRNPPMGGFGHRSGLISPSLSSPSTVASTTVTPSILTPNTSTTNGRLSPNPIRGKHVSPLLLPQIHSGEPDDASVHLPSPNVLAYYDIPPPSPPPMGPLPKVPAGFVAQQQRLSPPRAASQLRSKVLERQREVVDLSHLASQQPSMRGRESPFPARPVGLGTGYQGGRRESGSPQRVGPGWRGSAGSVGGGLAYDDDDEYDEYGETQEDEEGEDMRDVLDRFDVDADADERDLQSQDDHLPHRTLATRRSFEALARETKRPEDEANAPLLTDFYERASRETMYWDDGDVLRNRESRWSGSIYSRLSILDADQSEEARERFVQRVEVMMRGSGGGDREKVEEVPPPVPRIPEGILANSNSWNKF